MSTATKRADPGLAMWPAGHSRDAPAIAADGRGNRRRTPSTLGSGQALPVAPVVVACRPVLSAPADQDAIRRVVTAAFVPSRVLVMDTVRAAAIGSGAATGVLLIVDVGTQLSEVAVLIDGRVAAGRRAEVGTHDPASGGAPRLLAGVVTRHVADIGRNPRMRRLIAAALARGGGRGG
jgi:rod shape-determining protein MreB